MRFLLAAAVFAFAGAAPAVADPAADAVRNAALATFHAKSLHMSIAAQQGPAVEVDMIPPARLHASLGGMMEVIKIDGDMYVNYHGRWRKMHVPGLASFTKMVADGQHYTTTDFSAADGGMQTVGGAPLHAYHVASKHAANDPATIFIGGDGFIHRMEVTGRGGGAVITYSKFNAPLTIDPPALK